MKFAWKRWVAGISLAAAALAVAAPQTQARAFTYSTKIQTIRVGVLLANRSAWSAAQSSRPTFSYVFQALNARPDIRPYGWEILNPYAPPFLDEGTARRWGVTFDVANPPRINKNMAAYWEVYLHDATAEQLADYDVLYMPYPLNEVNSDEQLTVRDREKLRRAVDGGTILWIDNVGGGTTVPAVSGGKLFVTPAFRLLRGVNQYADPMDALVNMPFRLTGREARQIGERSTRSQITEAMVDNRTDMLAAWKPVLFAGANSVTAGVFSYGQGAVVVTGGAIGTKLTRGFRPLAGVDDTASGVAYRPGNTGPISGSDPRFLSVADLKFLTNVIAYRFQSPQPGAGPRHSSGSRQDLDTPLGQKWQNRVVPAIEQVSDPAVWNGIAFSVSSEGPGGFIVAYDMDPERDLDGDGNPDDGLPDPSGSTADIIWKVPLGNMMISSLVVGTVNGEPIVYAMRENGELMAIRAMSFATINGRRRLRPNPDVTVRKIFGDFPSIYERAWTKAGNWFAVPNEAGLKRIPAPVWYNGRLFVVGAQQAPAPNTGVGGIAEVNPANLTVRWSFPTDTLPSNGVVPPKSRMGLPTATPTVAAIPDKGYADATDIMLLVPTMSLWSSEVSGTTANQPSRVMAFPLGVRGERVLRATNEIDGMTVYLTRLANDNAIRVDESTARLWAPNGTSVPGIPGIDRSRGYSRLYFGSNVASDGDDIRADYDFLPGAPANNFQGYNARWSFDAWSYVLGNTALFMEILTSPVVSSDGAIYFVASDLGYGGNQAPIIMGLEMRQQRIAANLENNPTYLAPLNQPQLSFLYNVGAGAAGLATDTRTRQAVVMGTPAVDRGVLYAAWGQWPEGAENSWTSGAGGPTFVGEGGVSGFLVRNTRFGLLLQNPVNEAQKNSISVVQRNRYTGDFQQVGYGLFDVENISVGNALRGLLVFRSLSTGPGAASLDLSRPYDIQVSYQAVDPATNVTAGVTGETPAVYYRTMRGEGDDPSLLRAFNDRRVPKGSGGIRTGVTVAGGSIYVGSDAGAVWTVPLPTELERLQATTAEPLRPATFPSLATAASAGAGDPRAMILRSSPVVAANSLVQNAGVGVFTFYSPRTLITDSDRVLEVVSTYKTDTTGRTTGAGSAAVWSLNSTTQTRDFGQPGAGASATPWGDNELEIPISRALKQPTMAIRVNTTNTLICDTGNNRVVEVDRTGRVVWQATDFADPYGLLDANESRSLQSPTSVQRWETYDYEDDVPVRSVHTLIADSGNNRILELVTRYSPSPNQLMNNVVVWVGRGPAGTAYQFYQAYRLPYFPANASDPDFGNMDLGRTIASVTNRMVNSADAPVADLPGAMTNRPATAGGSIVLLGGRRDGAASGRVVYFLNTMLYGSRPTVFPLARPVFFQASVLGPGPLDWDLMLNDGQNIFNLRPSPTTPGLGLIPIDMRNGVFPIVGNAPLGPTPDGAMGSGGYTSGISMARRLANGNVLIVNQQSGIIFEFGAKIIGAPPPGGPRPTDLLQFIAPPISGTTGLSRPVYADRVF